ncbi:MAG: hypothetical protein IR160_01940 [Salinibacterium sp.]|nr:hypothetical protein [Salinibacterium sp.]MBF0671330.1 hypothetical protein [Salinibacterium sp.]
MLRAPVLCTLILAGMLGLTSCASTSAEPPAGTPTPSSDTGSTSETDGRSAGTNPDDPAECLHGTWLADNDFFLASLSEFGDAIDSVSGRVTMTFSPENTLATEYADWLLTGVTNGQAVTISRDGIDTGEYSVSGGAVSIEDTNVGSILTVATAGTEMPIPPVPAVYNDATFTCSQASASITTPDGTIQLTRE